jgi:SPX domain
MVEFGLKLEDNKVAEWRDKYVRYDRLKLVLDRVKKNSERYKALKAKNPSLASSIEEAYYRKKEEDDDALKSQAAASPTSKEDAASASGESSTSSGMGSTTATPSILRPASFFMDSERLALPSIREATATDAASVDETTSLMSGASSPQSSSRPETSQPHLRRVDSGNTFIQYLERAATGMNDFFEKQYVKQIRDALRAMDATADEFEALLKEDVTMVNDFYDEKLRDTQGRLQLLKESVAVSFFNLPPPPPPPEDSSMSANAPPGSDHSLYLETPLIDNQHRKRADGSSSNPFVNAVKKSLFTLQLHHQQQQKHHRKQKSSTDSEARSLASCR